MRMRLTVFDFLNCVLIVILQSLGMHRAPSETAEGPTALYPESCSHLESSSVMAMPSLTVVTPLRLEEFTEEDFRGETLFCDRRSL